MFRFVLNVLVLPACLLLPLALALCPEEPAADDPCTHVNDWFTLKSLISSASGAVILCPFDIAKTDRDPILLRKGATVMCRKTSEHDECTIRGEGEHIRSTSLDQVVFSGFSFKESDEHAVYIQSSSPTNVHTFCDCVFEDNRRVDGVRGGAFKTEKSTGVVNIASCTFRRNHCASFGGAIYTRSNFTNIVDSTFIGNTASGPGGAIAAAKYADLTITNSFFNENYGEKSYAIIIKPCKLPCCRMTVSERREAQN